MRNRLSAIVIVLFMLISSFPNSNNSLVAALNSVGIDEQQAITLLGIVLASNSRGKKLERQPTILENLLGEYIFSRIDANKIKDIIESTVSKSDESLPCLILKAQLNSNVLCNDKLVKRNHESVESMPLDQIEKRLEVILSELIKLSQDLNRALD